MRTLLIIAVVLLLLALPAAAQSSNHQATLNWIATPDALTNPSIIANVYRADGACPATGSPSGQVKIGSTLAGATTYIDTTVGATKTYCYTVRASLNGVESVDSNTAGAVIPLAPFSGLSVAVR